MVRYQGNEQPVGDGMCTMPKRQENRFPMYYTQVVGQTIEWRTGVHLMQGGLMLGTRLSTFDA